MTYCFGIDGTLFTETNGEYERSHPIQIRIDMVNKLHEQGNKIILSCSRGECNRSLTERQLEESGVQYDELFMDKVRADFYVDDRGFNVYEWFYQHDN